MGKVISIGNQGFESMREKDCFYVDKTNFIKEWWETEDCITLITRPRRFGKTLNMSMLDCFFSNKYANRSDLFEELSIWEEEKYRQLQGTYPVIFLTFADVKQTNYKDAVQKIKNIIAALYRQFPELLQWDGMSAEEKVMLSSVKSEMDDLTVQDAIKNLSEWLQRYYGKKPILLLDEYDTPIQEAWMGGYWEEFTAFLRNLFNSTFKTNMYLERAIMTGITRVSKESMFSDLNNLRVVTTTSDLYATCFGFTEEEVFASLEEMGMGDKKEIVKEWYDGFTFGEHHDIYNPWSITNYLKLKKLCPYWANTSSNILAGSLIQKASVEVKKMMEDLLNGQEIVVNFDEQIVFNQLEQDEDSIWSLLMASGYLKIENVEYRGLLMEPYYHLTITNLETVAMFSNLFRGWFAHSDANYNCFVKALLRGSLEEMNIYMNDVALVTFSNFDTGKRPSSQSQPERFYHGFVLGLLVGLREEYEVKSNRESGYGRYDVMLIPTDIHNEKTPAIVLEFKVHRPDKESSLQETVQMALNQIEEKNYDAELLARGMPKANIRHYGFAFEGKTVLIGER